MTAPSARPWRRGCSSRRDAPSLCTLLLPLLLLPLLITGGWAGAGQLQVAALVERHDPERVGSLDLVALCSIIASIG